MVKKYNGYYHNANSALILPNPWIVLAIISFAPLVQVSVEYKNIPQYCYENSLDFMYSLKGSQELPHPKASTGHSVNHCYKQY